MENIKLKGIYLHGYNGYVTEEKKRFLEDLGEIYAPHIIYDEEADIVHQLYDKFKSTELDFVSGTSLGGILAYHLAILLNVPCLLLNPAVTAMDQIKSFIPIEAFNSNYNKDTLVIVGLKDQIVKPAEQITFFEHKLGVTINQLEELEHFVPIDTFEESFKQFQEILK